MANLAYNTKTTIATFNTTTTTTTALASTTSSALLTTAPTTTTTSTAINSKQNTANLIANAFLIENPNAMQTPATTLPPQPPPPTYQQHVNTPDAKEPKKSMPLYMQHNLLETETTMSEKLINDKSRLSSMQPASPLDTAAFGPALNEPQKPRWLSSLHSVIFILTCALAVFIVFRNVLTW